LFGEKGGKPDQHQQILNSDEYKQAISVFNNVQVDPNKTQPVQNMWHARVMLEKFLVDNDIDIYRLPPGPQPKPSPPLGPGQIILICVIVGLGIIAAATATVYMLRRMKNKKNNQEESW
jgi:hypothetical protein